jgi:hypothetical protein
VTRVTAVFDAVKPLASQSQPPTRAPKSKQQFVAVVGQPVVRGVRPRRILITVRVNAPSSIAAMLTSARRRRVIYHSWQVASGSRVLRLSAPKRARRGMYVLRLTARDRDGHVKRFERRVRLRR